MKKIISRISFFLILGLCLGLLGYMGVKTFNYASADLEDDGRFFTGMITDGGGINDQSFQESAWKGMKEFSANTGAKVKYIECPQASDFFINIDKFADAKADLVWGIGYKLADVIEHAAKINPEINYAIADYSFGENTLDNVTGVVFRAEESSFLVGYIAALTTKRDVVGFVGGIKGMVIDQFEYGYRAGVAYGAKQLGKNIMVKVQYAESFTDAAKCKAIAMKMFDDCDVIFHAAGGGGTGIIEAAKETGKYAIGADMDQSKLAPKNVLTSAIKDVGKAINIVSLRVMNGENLGGQSFSYGIKEGCVGIPDENPNIPESTMKKVEKVKEKICKEEILPPGTSEKYEDFIKHLA